MKSSLLTAWLSLFFLFVSGPRSFAQAPLAQNAAGYQFLAIGEFLMDSLGDFASAAKLSEEDVKRLRAIDFSNVKISDGEILDANGEPALAVVDPESNSIVVSRKSWELAVADNYRFLFVFQCYLNAAGLSLSQSAKVWLQTTERKFVTVLVRLSAAKRAEPPVSMDKSKGPEALLNESQARAQHLARWERTFLLLRDPAPEIRSSALLVLLKALKSKEVPALPKARTISYLTQLLADTDIGVRREARHCLAALGNEAIGPLMQLAQFAPAPVAEIAADTLGDMGKEADAAVPALRWLNVRFVGTGDWSRSAVAAADNLRNIGTPEALKALQWLDNDVLQARGPEFERRRQDADRSAIQVPGLAREKVSKQALRTTEANLFSWEAGLNSLFWTNPNRFAEPNRHYERQCRLHALLVALGENIPVLPVPTPEDYVVARREVIGVLNASHEAPWPSLLVWEPGIQGANWTNPNSTESPWSHYQRQSYLLFDLLRHNGIQIKPVVTPTVYPKSKNGFHLDLRQQRSKDNEPNKKKSKDYYRAGVNGRHFQLES